MRTKDEKKLRNKVAAAVVVGYFAALVILCLILS